jgi:hypothetical protein
VDVHGASRVLVRVIEGAKPCRIELHVAEEDSVGGHEATLNSPEEIEGALGINYSDPNEKCCANDRDHCTNPE